MCFGDSFLRPKNRGDKLFRAPYGGSWLDILHGKADIIILYYVPNSNISAMLCELPNPYKNMSFKKKKKRKSTES